jgi:pilus assembly protein CpaC
MRSASLGVTTILLAAVALQAQAPAAKDLIVTVGKSVLVDSPVNIERVSVANSEVADAFATTAREVLVTGKAQGETSLIIWQTGGNRLFFDLAVRPNPSRFDAVRREIAREIPDQDVSFEVQDDSVFLRGTVPDLTAANRAVQIVSTLGKPVNLLRVSVPPVETQVLIKVRFANVDRSVNRDLGVNLFSTGLGGTIGRTTTGQFSPPGATLDQGTGGVKTQLQFSDLLNLFFFRPDLDFGATIKALQAKSLLEILAEPNVLALNGRPASFLAGGEFPFPTLQGGGAGLGQVTVQFREFGVRINFTPTVTPRGTIRMSVGPEVSSLDYANALTVQGFTIPALSTRRVQTEVELESGQSFAIGGLLDNRAIENLQKVPGLGDIPFFGKLFRSQHISRNNTELLVIVTPEIVRPIPRTQPLPELKFPQPFLEPNSDPAMVRTPGLARTGPVPVTPAQPTIAVEQLIESQQRSSQPGGTQQQQPSLQFVPMLTPPAAAPASKPQAVSPSQPAAAGPLPGGGK